MMRYSRILIGLSVCLAVEASAVTVGREKVVFVCAHPDDLAGCSGTAFLLAEKFDVKVVDFTAGEGGLGEEGYLDGTTARKRMAEERKACAMLGTEPVFIGELNWHGSAYAGREATEKLRKLFADWKPRAVILHWPLDTHPDHIQSYAAAIHAIYLLDLNPETRLNPEIYFHEQTTQSRTFLPRYHVDITRVKERKDKLILCYECQWAEAMRRRKEDDAVFRGRRIGVGYAESFSVWEGSVPPGGKSVLEEIGAR